MKKKFFCVLLAILFSFSFFYNPLTVKATGVEALPFIVSTGWDSTVAAYGALKGFQYGTTSETPEIVGDYTKPYSYTSESIAPLKPSWDSYADNFFVNNWSDLYPVYSEADAKKAWDLEKKSFDEKIGLGSIDMNSYLYNVLNQWLPSLVGTDYITVSDPNKTQKLTSSLNGPYSVKSYNYYAPPFDFGVYQDLSIDKPQGCGDVSGYIATGIYIDNSDSNGVLKYKEISCLYLFDKTNHLVWHCTLKFAYGSNQIYVADTIWTSSNNANDYEINSDYGSVGVNLDGQSITDRDYLTVPNTGKVIGTDKISQLPVGNPNDNDDKDNKKISVLPNVPSISGNLNNLGNINGGNLPIKFPDVNPNTGLIPSIPVLGNGGITVNIPVTNNNYEVINNYDEHQEIYNNNYSYPTINYNYVNYYVNEGAITYEQFLQALQKYFNVIVYNNETNNYYPSTINNVTNNYYTIEEVITEEIPPILPPARISITDRFPFCLPFDIYKILVLLNAEPTPWEWDVPVPTFVNGGTSNENYHGEIGHIDFSETMHISLEEWEPVAKVLRTCLSVLWLVFLCFLFMKLVH